MNIFDALEAVVFNAVSSVMGYKAEWTPRDGGETQTATVLYKGPSEKEKLAGVEFDPEGLKMEYKFGDFLGLNKAAEKGAREKVKIYDVAGETLECYVTDVKELWDGKTFQAMLVLKK